jgi:hypothetical protein
MRWASVPSISFAAMTSSSARPSPTTAGSRDEPPTSGTRPTRVSGRPMIASAAIVRRSHASASSIAAPRQAPDLRDRRLRHPLERVPRLDDGRAHRGQGGARARVLKRARRRALRARKIRSAREWNAP